MVKNIFSFKLLFFLFINSITLNAQIPTDSWRDHLPYNEGIEVAVAKNKVYCATTSALFYIDMEDHSINRLNPINGMSDLGIGSIAYCEKNDVLVVGYTNGNIDLVKEDGIVNLPDLKDKNIIADKSINQVSIFGDSAYLACGFGIIVLNIAREEISDTYVIGPNSSFLKINYVGELNQEIVALTEFGIYKANKNQDFLSYYKNWSLDTTVANYNSEFLSGTLVHDKIYAGTNDDTNDEFLVYAYDGIKWDFSIKGQQPLYSLSNSDSKLHSTGYYQSQIYNSTLELVDSFNEHSVSFTIYDYDGTLWASKKRDGLVSVSSEGGRTNYLPNGPNTKDAFAMALNKNDLLVAPGGYKRTSENTFTEAQIFQFGDERWKNYTQSDEMLQEKYDVVTFASTGKSGNYYAGTWGYGLLEVKDNELSTIYTESNTDSIIITLGTSYSGISGTAMDRYGNLWIVQRNLDEPFAVKTADGDWYKHAYGSAMAKSHTGKLINTQNGDFWTISRKKGSVFVWNDNRTPDNSSDDVYKHFTFTDGNGAKISEELYAIVEDRKGAIWIGSTNGVAVYDYPSNVLNGRDFYARRPQVVVDGFLNNLLEGNTITDIVVDGGNRKWIATAGGGLFLVSETGSEQVMNLNVSNSSLFSDNILSLTFNEENGELFIGTDKGILSYMTSSSGGRSNLSDIYAFPNPVRSDYTGLITIRGLVYETQVHITDLAGNLVFKDESQGGDLVWNGHDLSGNMVQSGIYIVLCSNNDGTMAEATKILFVR